MSLFESLGYTPFAESSFTADQFAGCFDEYCSNFETFHSLITRSVPQVTRTCLVSFKLMLTIQCLLS